MNDRELADEIGGMIFDAIKHGDEKHQAWLHDKSHELGQQIIAALRRSQPEGEPATEAVLEMALTRMDRAREILRGPNANWGMLDTSDLRAALKGKGASQGAEETYRIKAAALGPHITGAAPAYTGEGVSMLQVPSAAPEPSGEFVRVPREPTDAMLDALEQGPALLHDSESWQDYQRRQWALVLAAAQRKPSGK